jgi:glyoxylase-like metal-dependent hydrolase (beta-lactamase superfamily II)
VIRRGEWEVAHSDNLRIRASYLSANFDPLMEHDVIDFVDEDVEVAPGVRLVGMPGHTADHQGVLVDLGDTTVCYPADLVPTAAHVRLPWIMAYDLEPLVTGCDLGEVIEQPV